MEPLVDKAVRMFEEGYSCSQAVLSAYAPSLGLSEDLACKVSGAFGGGMARAGERCGAVTGAMMAIGLAHSSATPNAEAKAKTYELTEKLVAEFKRRNGCIACRELIGFDLSTEEGREQARLANTHQAVCPKFVQDAAEIVDGLL